jgi:hypothetical protein
LNDNDYLLNSVSYLQTIIILLLALLNYIKYVKYRDENFSSDGGGTTVDNKRKILYLSILQKCVNTAVTNT